LWEYTAHSRRIPQVVHVSAGHLPLDYTARQTTYEEIAEYEEEEQECYPDVLEEYEEDYESGYGYAQYPRLSGITDLPEQIDKGYYAYQQVQVFKQAHFLILLSNII